nr:cytochrome c [uncultured bacterium]
MKKLIFLFALSIFLYSCGGGDKKSSTSKPKAPAAAPVDDGKGFGIITEVKLNNPLDQEMVERGRLIYDMKCASCHKKSAKRVVGPGWAGLTDRRKPEWIMNMITNVETMLDKDPTAQKLLEECLTRMPNQNVSVDEARDILEFIYQNDADQKAKDAG